MTLVGGIYGKEIDLIEKVKLLSNVLNPINVIFDKINYLDQFFRSFFLEVKLTNELESARNIACNTFDYPDNDYLPHISLAYGNYDRSIKLKMADNFCDIPLGFIGNKIFLANNNENDLRWEIISSVNLKSLV